MVSAGIYTHIPFCNSICNYCDYFTLEKQEENAGQFVDLLCREIALTAKIFDKEWIFDTLYFGGGSPGTLKIEDLLFMIEKLRNYFDLSKLNEITLELNPGENSYKDLEMYRKMGINRLSLGFQSLQPALLTLLTRRHHQDDGVSLFHHARQAGFDNINVDMMFNIPGQTTEMWLSDLENIVELKPEHITLYSLTIEKGTPYFNLVQSGEIQMPASENSQLMFIKGSQLIRESGFTHYEVSHFAQPGRECLHNLHYWQREPNLAFGPSAHGFDGEKRYWNESSLENYIGSLSNNTLPIENLEVLTDIQIKNEIIMNGLRTKLGIPVNCLINGQNSPLQKWEEFLIRENGSVYLMPAYFSLADEIASDLMVGEN